MTRTEAIQDVLRQDFGLAENFEEALATNGYVVVPKEPTTEMLSAFASACDEHGHCLVKTGYRAMIGAYK